MQAELLAFARSGMWKKTPWDARAGWSLFKHLVSPYCKRLSALLDTGYIRYLSRALNVPRLGRVGSLPFEMLMVP